jgi:2-polyprenyl-6-methoxyphenol hydroxylase-like FAD-dependent oxidoreductase
MGMEEKDAVIVGARCAGSTLALALAKRGWNVLVVDGDRFPSETISTHGIYPNTLARFDQLGVMETLRASHDVPLLASRLVGLENEVAGLYTPIDGYDRMAVIRRSALDKAIIDTALQAGAEGRFGERVVDLIGSGTEEDPVAGVVLENGDRAKSKWVFGADGRASTVARRLGIERERALQGEVSFLFGYWRGIPNNDYATLQIHEREFASRTAVEDGLHLLIAMGDAELTRGNEQERRRKYVELLGRFPEMLEPGLLEQAEMVGDVVVAPESLMRGFFRKPTGPGWALVGDASHFKHPGTAQGIADAVEAALYVAERVSSSLPGLEEYEAWRDARAVEHYEWSFAWGRFPHPETATKLWRGWAGDAEAGQDLRDSFSRLVEPSQVTTKERLARWFGDAVPERA